MNEGFPGKRRAKDALDRDYPPRVMPAALVKPKERVEHGFNILSAALLVAAVAFLFHSIISGWFSFVEENQTYSYALLLPPVALGLILLKMRQVGWRTFLKDSSSDRLGYALIAVGCLMLLAGREALLLFVMRLSFLVVLIGVVLALFGRRNLARVAFPLGLMLLAIPLPATIYLPLSGRLQLVSSAIAGHGLNLLGVPALRQGNIIVLPNATLEVAQACSGIHSLFALTATAALAAYLLVEDRLAQVLVLLSAVPIAILFNGLRIILTATACYTISPQAAQGIAHLSTGFVVFALGCALIVTLCVLLSRRQARAAGKKIPAVGSRPGELKTKGGSLALLRWNVVAATAVALFAFAIQGGVHMDRPVPLQRSLSAFPLQLGQWHGQPVPVSQADLKSLNPSAILTRVYAAPHAASPVELYVAYYSRQETGETMHSPMHCIPGAGWEVDDSASQIIPSGKYGNIHANRLLFQREGQRMLVVYWYMQQGEPERSQLSGIIHTFWRSVVERRSDGCLIRLSAPVSTTVQKTETELTAFARHAVPLLMNDFLPLPSSKKLLVASKR